MSSRPKDIPSTTPVSIPRRHLATYNNAYAVAVRLKEVTGADQYVVSTADIAQPFRVMSGKPCDRDTIVSLIA